MYLSDNNQRNESSNWFNLAPGVLIHILRVSTETGHFTTLVKASAGSTLPRHRHLGPAEVYILLGSGEHPQTGEFSVGDYIYETSGALHEEVEFQEDVELLMISQGPSAFLDKNDRVLYFMDASMLVSLVSPGNIS